MRTVANFGAVMTVVNGKPPTYSRMVGLFLMSVFIIFLCRVAVFAPPYALPVTREQWAR